MTIGEHRRLRIIIATLSPFLAGAVSARHAMAQAIAVPNCSPSSCVPMTLNANVQLTKLHPAVSHVATWCTVPIPAGQWTMGAATLSTINRRSNSMPVVNRGYAGIVTVVIEVPKVILDNPANRTLNPTCRLQLLIGGQLRDAVASAAQPESLTSGNWHVVATGSTIMWTQAVTIPNVP